MDEARWTDVTYCLHLTIHHYLVYIRPLGSWTIPRTRNLVGLHTGFSNLALLGCLLEPLAKTIQPRTARTSTKRYD